MMETCSVGIRWHHLNLTDKISVIIIVARRVDMFETIQQFHHDWVGLDLITSPSKLESFLWLVAKEEVRGLKYEKY